jgi:hypothetical protein
MGSEMTIIVNRGLEMRIVSDEEEKGPVCSTYLVKLHGRGKGQGTSIKAGMDWSVHKMQWVSAKGL